MADDTKNYKILIMDDEDYICNILSKMYEKFGYRVELTSAGEQAVEHYKTLKAKGTPADLVILDLTIPDGMSGREAASLILDFDPDAKIIISTGNPYDPMLSNYRDLGIKNILTKPFRMDHLIKITEQTIKNA